MQVAILEGDGVGPEVVAQGVRVLQAAAEQAKLDLTLVEGLIGGAAIDTTGEPLPEVTRELTRTSDAILLGAVGGAKWDSLPLAQRPERGLLALRRELNLFANLRFVRLSPHLANTSPLRPEVAEGTDLVIFRELTGGLYYGEPRKIEPCDGAERGIDTLVYTTPEIERIARPAFEAARARRKKVTSVDKANVLMSSVLWRRTVTELAKGYRDVTVDHMYVDNCAMQLIRDPRQFDVIVTENMFGDILSDEASVIAGSIGLLPSASLGAEVALYEPIHGTAPDIAGTDRANPIGTILSVALLLRYSAKQEEVARAIEGAVEATLASGARTADIAAPGQRPVGCREMGDRILATLG